MEIIDVKESKQIKGKYEVNIILDGFCLQTIAMYNSDIESLINNRVLFYTRKDKSVDSAGILLTSKAYKTK